MCLFIHAQHSDYISRFYIDIITYPCSKLDADLVNLCYEKGPLASSKGPFNFRVLFY